MVKQSFLILILFLGISNAIFSQSSLLGRLEKKAKDKVNENLKKQEQKTKKKEGDIIDHAFDRAENLFRKGKNAVNGEYKYTEIKESDFNQFNNIKDPKAGFSRLKIANNLFLDVKGEYPKGYNPKWRFISYKSELQYEVADWVFQNASTKYENIPFTLGDYDGKAIIEFKPYIGNLAYAIVDIQDIAVISEKPQTFKITNFEKVVNNRMSGQPIISLNNGWYMNGGFGGKITLSCDEEGNLKMDLLIESYSKKENMGRTYHEPQVYKAYHANGVKIDNEMSPSKANAVVKAEQEAKQRQKDYEEKTTKQADVLQKAIAKKYPQKDCRECFISGSNSNLSITPTETLYENSYGDVYSKSGTDWDIKTKTSIKNKCNYPLLFVGIQQLHSEEKGYYLEEVTKIMPAGYTYENESGLLGTLFSSLTGGGSEFNFRLQDKYYVQYASVGSVQWLRVIRGKK